MARVLAITTCRVSSTEQLQNNSLTRQREAVLKAAEHLGAEIPEDAQWSGSVSSKAGTNIYRKDLEGMLDYCRKNKAVKYLIVHEVDRFMRSLEELFYFEVEFKKLGVKVWYASQPELNTDDTHSKLLKALEAFKGEGSNLERQRKSIDGNADSLRKGRYPFSPKPGYKRGYERGVQEVHPIKGPILRKTLFDIAESRLTPTQALIEFNKSEFMNGHSPYKMDKFRTIVTDPFYVGILHIDKQIKVHNENGLHEKLIAKEQHLELVRIMNDKKKNQSGPRKNGNPKFPLNNIVHCELCTEKRNGRYVGYDHSNGKNPNLVYEKYRCRACGRYLTRQELHKNVEQHISSNPIKTEGLEDLLEALNIVWRQKENGTQQEIGRIQNRINFLNESVPAQVEAAIDPSNVSIKDEIMASIFKKKSEVEELKEELETLASEADNDKEQFLRFAFDFVDNLSGRFLELSPENRLQCKQVLFPAGFYLNAKNKVYTPEISPLITLQTKKKSTEVPNNSHLVRVRGL